MAQFRTIEEAIAAGYRRPNPVRDEDISGYNMFGYAYRDADGHETVTVSLSEARNRIRGVGAFTAMYPPRS